MPQRVEGGSSYTTARVYTARAHASSRCAALCNNDSTRFVCRRITKMITCPHELNRVSDVTLSTHVAGVLRCLHDAEAPAVPAVSRFITTHVLLRLHNMVAEARKGGDSCAGWSKQATLARVVSAFTGVKLCQSDAEYIGNANDYFLKDFVKKLSKAENAEARAIDRARKSGRDLPAESRRRTSELKLEIYRCKFGGVPRNVLSCGGFRDTIHRQPVPLRKIQHADDMNVMLQKQIIDLKKETGRERDMQHNLNALCAAVEIERRTREQVERTAAELAQSHAEAASKTAAKMHELKRRIGEAHSANTQAQAQVLRLESQLGAAHVEQARAMEREKNARMEAEKAWEDSEQMKVESASQTKEQMREFKKRLREAEKANKLAQGQVVLLGCKLGAAHVEHAKAIEREDKVRKDAEHAANDAAQAQLDAVAAVSAKLKSSQSRVQSSEKEAKETKGKLERLGFQLGAALVEAGRATEYAREAHTTSEELNKRLREQEEEAQRRIEHLRALKAQMAKRARNADKRAGTVDLLRSQLESARKKLAQVRKELNVTKVHLNLDLCEMSDSDSDVDAQSEAEHVDDSDNEASESMLALKRIRSMPTWRAVRGKGCGRGEAKIEWGTRVTIYSLLSMMVPPAAIGRAIVAIVKRTAPWINPAAPTCETVKRCRFELRFVEEALSARRVASAYRIRSIGFDETTKFGNTSLTSNVQIEPVRDAPLENVILRAAYCPMGGTADIVVQSIETKCMSRLRDLLRRWKATFVHMFPEEPWTGPDCSHCSLHRLGGGGAIISDTCNTARKSRELLAQLVAAQVKEHIGVQVWGTMSEEERKQVVRTHNVDCWQHLRNIFLAEMSRAQAQYVQNELKAELDTFSSWERMSTDFSQLLRASFKEFHHSCRYYKGKGRSYSVWLRQTYPSNFVIHLERADGGRQDLDYDAAVPMYVNRRYFVEFLHDRVFEAKHSNVLEDFLYVTFRSVQYVAMARANAIIDILISRPLRWLSGKSAQLAGWSPSSMGEALDLVEQFFMRAQHNGGLFFDPELDLFKQIAEKQPLFAEWRRYTFDDDFVFAPDGMTKHLLWNLARKELLWPSDATNAVTQAKTVEYLEVQCVAGLRKMHDPKLALCDKLTSMDGANSIGNSLEAHMDTIGCHATNDALAESVFGTYDMILRRCPGVSMEAASAVAQSVRSMMLSVGDHVAHRKENRKQQAKANVAAGWFHTLPEKEQEALVECARISVKEMRDIDANDHSALDEYHKSRRKTNSEEELDALFTRYALALSFFERWCKRGVRTVNEISTALSGYGDRNQDKLDWLREQIEMRCIGMSWTGWKTPWSSSTDDNIGTVDQLRAHLKDVLAEEESLKGRGLLPCKARALESVEGLQAECPAPQMQRKTFKTLGMPTVQSDALSCDRTTLTNEELVIQAQRRRTELEAAGEIDWVGDRQPYPTGQGPTPDKSLVGKLLEVRWRYRHQETGEPVYIWAEGEVVQAADGETDKKSARCKKILPAGALRIKWPADVDFDEDESFVWSILNPHSFNKDVHLGWRFAASEIKLMEATASNQQAKKPRRK